VNLDRVARSGDGELPGESRGAAVLHWTERGAAK
jgi:hypothetical protein